MSYEINTTTVQINKELRDKLNELKESKESLNDVIVRIYKFYIKNMEE